MSTAWRARPERSTPFVVRAGIAVALYGGRAAIRAAAWVGCLYFLATAPETRAASREFLTRALGKPAGLRQVLAHLHCFGTTLVDRAYLLTGQHDRFHVEVENEQVLRESLALGRGCLLFGSHLGSFEMLGVVGSVAKGLPVNVVMNVDENSNIHRLLAEKGGGLPYRVIALGSPGAMMAVRECLERGEIVGLLVDRVYGTEQTCALPFFGTPAPFSLAPFQLARITGAPVVMAFAIFEGGQRYRVSFTPLAARIEREAGAPCDGLSPWMQQYVDELERRARAAPFNWFNFYDYWASR
ncbi:lipid A biosynthesis acyltransferase [Usitatibacter palustris]|uniref:Lipid A biosynthesis lauroyltransferase n=1 Tax=Usitatibacter palustris TaxID=2732487 RepID=A0A6M4H8T8_9PROT|nr:lipid A biosynthesis acyltransferase [Usitatibacter palustris]QJR15722.1 Lipid A biosynthesis lauroyltransferase [Usitatibacter palustris]